jgi:hypothetical protein
MKLPRLFSLVAVVLCFPGCREAAPPAADESREAAPAEPEATFESQLAAVRAGESQTIKSSAEVSAEQFGELATGCEGLQVLHLTQPQIGDEDLSILPRLVSLRQLVLHAPIGDAGLDWIAQCPSLEIVNLPSGTFSDAGLQRLEELPLLTLLRFSSPGVTDAGLASIPEMENLRFLHLIDVPVTDDGLDAIKQAPLLESFYLDGGKCTEEGLSCLAKARPALHIHLDQLHLPGHDHGHSHDH